MNTASRDATTLDGVHMLLAMPQWYLNANLQDLLANGRTTTGASLSAIALRSEPAAVPWLEGEIEKLAVKVWKEGNPGHLGFLVTFKAGTFRYSNTSAAIAGLTMAFAVNLDPVRGVWPGAFSTERLLNCLLDASAAVFDTEAAVIPSGMPSEAFAKAISAHLLAGGSLLGYSVAAVSADDPAPSLPLTDVRLGTLRFSGNAYNDDNLDTLAYSMMTAGAAFPSGAKPSGNFVIPAAGPHGTGFGTGYGTLAVANDVVLRRGLLPKLAPVICQIWLPGNNNAGLAPVLTGQQHPLTMDPPGASFTVNGLTCNTTKPEGNGDTYVQYDVGWKVAVELSTDSNVMRVHRFLNFNVTLNKTTFTPRMNKWPQCEIDYHLELITDIELLGVMDGALQVAVSSTTAPNLTPHPEVPCGGYAVRVVGTLEVLDSELEEMKDIIGDLVSLAIPSGYDQQIAKQLNSSPLVLAAGGQINLVDPSWNIEGDLLFGVSGKS